MAEGGAYVAEETTTAVDGTYPTGMHSCSSSVYICILKIYMSPFVSLQINYAVHFR